MLHRCTTLSAASRSENSYLRRGIEGGTVIPLRLSVINANGETDICSHCLRRNTDAMHRDVYKSMQPTRCSVWNYGKCKTLVFCQSSICLKEKGLITIHYKSNYEYVATIYKKYSGIYLGYIVLLKCKNFSRKPMSR